MGPEYHVIELDEQLQVVNPMYSKIMYRLKKIREKIQRRRALLYQLEEQNSESDEVSDKK